MKKRTRFFSLLLGFVLVFSSAGVVHAQEEVHSASVVSGTELSNVIVEEATETVEVEEVTVEDAVDGEMTAYADDDVASVTIGGETKNYTTLAAAFASVQSGQTATITLLRNSEAEDYNANVMSGVTVIFDLAGYTVDRSLASYGIGVLGTLYIKDTVGNGSIASEIGVLNQGGIVYVDGGTINGSTYGVQNGYEGVLTVSGGAINGGNSGVLNYYESVLTVSDGAINGNYYGIYNAGSTVYVNGGAIKGTLYYGILNYYGLEENATVTGTVEISGGEISGAERGVASVCGKISVSGGTVSGEQIGITGADTTIDISGGTISGTANGAMNVSSSAVTMSAGTLTGASGISLFNSDKNNEGSIPSSFTMTGGTIDVEYFAVSGNNLESAGTKVTISGNSTLTASEGTAIYWPMEGTLDIKGGNITGQTGIEIKMGTLNVSGGNITGTGEYNVEFPMNGGSEPDGSAILISGQMYGGVNTQYINSNDLTVNITGGNLVSQQGTAVIAFEVLKTDAQSVAVNLENGTYAGKVSAFDVLRNEEDNTADDKMTEVVTGGIYSSKVDTEYVKESYTEVGYTADGTKLYYVGTPDGLADQIGELLQNSEGKTVELEVITGDLVLDTTAYNVDLKVTNSEENTSGKVTVNDAEVESGGGEVVIHNLEHHAAVEPTCTEKGNSEYWYCSICDTYFSDADAAKTTSLEAVTIPAKGHTLVHVEAKDATEKETGNLEYWYCSVCGKYFLDADAKQETEKDAVIIPVKKPSGQTPTPEPQKKPAKTESTKKEEPAKESAKKAVKTGDNTEVALLFALMLMAGSCAVITRKKIG